MSASPAPGSSGATPPARPPFTAYRLPLPKRRERVPATLAAIVHAAIVVALVWGGRTLSELGGGGSGPLGGGGGSGRPILNFFALPPSPPAVQVDLPPLPDVAVLDLPEIAAVPVDLGKIEVPHLASQAASGGPGQGSGQGGGQGTGVGPGIGSHTGPGTGGEAGYIFPPTPRGVILPPVNAPSSVKGRRYRVAFWVGVDGRVIRVSVVPEIADARYRREFIERMMGYVFTPAVGRDGARVPGVTEIVVTP